jgi:hypothetical protein
VKLRSSALKKMTVLAACSGLTLWTAGPANAAAYTWQSYSRDSSWNCGPPGSTISFDGLYLLPCTKAVGSSWQIILIVTAGGSTRYIADEQVEYWGNGTYVKGDCYGNDLRGEKFTPGMSLACFSPTLTNANTWVWGQFNVTVSDNVTNTASNSYDSPLVLTGS